MIRYKLCMLGSFAVGKTSLVRRFVLQAFSDRYETTVGVKILKRTVRVGGEDATLMIWDLHGDDEFQRVRSSYLRGSTGYVLVADGTRPATLETALRLDEMARGEVGEVPSVLLFNKSDLVPDWEVEDEVLERHAAAGRHVHRTSAKTGEGVEAAFDDLALRMFEA